jgi:hypothetical protein
MTFSDFRKAFADEQFFSDQKQRVPIVSSELGSFDPRAVVHMATSNRLKKEEILKVFSEAVTIECEVEEIQDVETSTVCTSKLCSVFEGCKHVVKSGDLVLVDDSGFATNGDLPGALIKYWLKDMSRLPNGPATESQSIGAAVKDGPMFVATVKRKGYFKHHGKDEFGWDTHFWVGDKTAHELKVERGESSRSRALCIIKDALTAPPCYTFMFNDFGVPCPLDGLPKTVSRLISELNRWKLPLSCDWRFENGAYHVFPGSRSLEDLPPDSIVATPTKFMIGGKRSHRIKYVFEVDSETGHTDENEEKTSVSERVKNAVKKVSKNKVNPSREETVIESSTEPSSSTQGPSIEFTARVQMDESIADPIMKMKGVEGISVTSRPLKTEKVGEKWTKSTTRTKKEAISSSSEEIVEPETGTDSEKSLGFTKLEEFSQSVSDKVEMEITVSTGMLAVLRQGGLKFNDLMEMIDLDHQLLLAEMTKVVHIEKGVWLRDHKEKVNRFVEYAPHALCVISALLFAVPNPTYGLITWLLAITLLFFIWQFCVDDIVKTIYDARDISDGQLYANVLESARKKEPISSRKTIGYSKSTLDPISWQMLNREVDLNPRVEALLRKKTLIWDEDDTAATTIQVEVIDENYFNFFALLSLFPLSMFIITALVWNSGWIWSTMCSAVVAVSNWITSWFKHKEEPIVEKKPAYIPLDPSGNVRLPDMEVVFDGAKFNINKTVDALEDLIKMIKTTTRPKELLEEVLALWVYNTERAIALTIMFGGLSIMLVGFLRFLLSMFTWTSSRGDRGYNFQVYSHAPTRRLPIIRWLVIAIVVVLLCSMISVEKVVHVAYGAYSASVKEPERGVIVEPQVKHETTAWTYVKALIGTLVFAVSTGWIVYKRVSTISRILTVVLTSLYYAVKAWNNNLHIFSSHEVIEAVDKKNSLRIVPDETGHNPINKPFDAVMASKIIDIEFDTLGRTGRIRGFISGESLVTCYHDICARPIVDQDGKQWKPTNVDVQQDYVVYGRDFTFVTPSEKELSFIPTTESRTGMMVGVVAKTPSNDFCVVSPFKMGHSGSPIITLGGVVGVQNVVINTEGPGKLSDFAVAENYFLGANILVGAVERTKASFDKAIMTDANCITKVVAGTGTGKSTVLPIGIHERLKNEAKSTSTVVLMTPMRVPAENAGKMLKENLAKKGMPSDVFVRHSGENFGVLKPGQIRVYTTSSIVASICTLGWDAYMRANSDVAAFIVDEVHVADAATQFMRLMAEHVELRAGKRWITTTATPLDGAPSLDTPFSITDKITKSDIFEWATSEKKIPLPPDVLGTEDQNVIWFLPTVNSCNMAKNKLESLGKKVYLFTSVQTADQNAFSATMRDIWRKWEEGIKEKFIVVATSAAETGVTLPVHLCVSSGLMVVPTKFDDYGFSLLRSTPQVLVQQRGRVGRKFEGTHLVCGREVTESDELFKYWSDGELVELMCVNAGVPSAGIRPSVYEDAKTIMPPKRIAMQMSSLPYDFARFIVDDHGGFPKDVAQYMDQINPTTRGTKRRDQNLRELVEGCQIMDYKDSITKVKFKVKSPCSPTTIPLEIARMMRVSKEEQLSDDAELSNEISTRKYTPPVKGGGVKTFSISDKIIEYLNSRKELVAHVVRTQYTKDFFSSTSVTTEFSAKVKREYGYEMGVVDVCPTTDFGISHFDVDEKQMEVEYDGETVEFKVKPREHVGPAHGYTAGWFANASTAYLADEIANDVKVSLGQELSDDVNPQRTALFGNLFFRSTESLLWLIFGLAVFVVWLILIVGSNEDVAGIFWFFINPLGLTFFAQSAILSPLAMYTVAIKAAHEIGWKKGLKNGAQKVAGMRQRTSSVGRILSFALGPGLGDLLMLGVMNLISDYSASIATEASTRAQQLSLMGNFATERAWNEEMSGDEYPFKRQREAELSLFALLSLMFVVSPLLAACVLAGAYCIHKYSLLASDINNSHERCVMYSFSILAPIVLNFLHFRPMSAMVCSFTSYLAYAVAEQCTIGVSSRIMVLSSVVVMRLTGYASAVSYSGVFTHDGKPATIKVGRKQEFIPRPINKHHGRSFLSSSVRITDYERLYWDRKPVNVQSLRACSKQKFEDIEYSNERKLRPVSHAPHAYLNFIAMTKVVSGLLPNPTQKSCDLTFGDGSLYAAIYDLCGRDLDRCISQGDRRRYGNGKFADVNGMSWNILSDLYPFIDEVGEYYALHHNVQPKDNLALLKNLRDNADVMLPGASMLMLVRKPNIELIEILTELSSKFKGIRAFMSPREYCSDARVYFHFQGCGNHDKAAPHYFVGVINEVKFLSYRVEHVDLRNADLYIDKFKREHTQVHAKRSFIDYCSGRLRQVLEECDVDTWTNDVNLAQDFKNVLDGKMFDVLPEYKKALVFEVLVNPLRRAQALELKNVTFERLIGYGVGCAEMHSHYGTLPTLFNLPGMARPDMVAKYARIPESEAVLAKYEPEMVSMIMGASVQNDIFGHAIATRCGSPYSGDWSNVEDIYKLCRAGKYLRATVEKAFRRVGRVRSMTKDEIIQSLNLKSTLTASEVAEFRVRTLGEAVELPSFWEKVYRQLDGYLTSGVIDCGYNLIPKVEKRGNLKAKHFLGDRVIPRAIECLAGSARVASMMLFMDFSHKLYGGERPIKNFTNGLRTYDVSKIIHDSFARFARPAQLTGDKSQWDSTFNVMLFAICYYVAEGAFEPSLHTALYRDFKINMYATFLDKVGNVTLCFGQMKSGSWNTSSFNGLCGWLLSIFLGMKTFNCSPEEVDERVVIKIEGDDSVFIGDKDDIKAMFDNLSCLLQFGPRLADYDQIYGLTPESCRYLSHSYTKIGDTYWAIRPTAELLPKMCMITDANEKDPLFPRKVCEMAMGFMVAYYVIPEIRELCYCLLDKYADSVGTEYRVFERYRGTNLTIRPNNVPEVLSRLQGVRVHPYFSVESRPEVLEVLSLKLRKRITPQMVRDAVFEPIRDFDVIEFSVHETAYKAPLIVRTKDRLKRRGNYILSTHWQVVRGVLDLIATKDEEIHKKMEELYLNRTRSEWCRQKRLGTAYRGYTKVDLRTTKHLALWHLDRPPDRASPYIHRFGWKDFAFWSSAAWIVSGLLFQ